MSEKRDKRHPLAIAWDEWLASEQGQRAVEFYTLTPGRYLENRLANAFQAGVEAQRKLAEGER